MEFIPNTKLPIQWTIPATLYGLKYSRRINKHFCKIYPEYSEDLKIIYKTKGRDEITGLNVPHIKRVVDKFNEDIIDPNSNLLSGVLFFKRKIPKYFKLYFKDSEKHKEYRDLILWYSHKINRRKDNESVNKLLRGAPFKVKKYFFKNILPKSGKEKKYPSLLTMSQNFTKSMTRWMSSNFEMANEKTIQKRLDICKGCEFWDKDALNKTGRCIKCGCSTAFKIRLQTEHCPINKW